MAKVISEYEVESRFIERLESLGYEYVELKNYDDVVENFRNKITEFNADKIKAAKGVAKLSDQEFNRIMIFIMKKEKC